MASPNTQPSLLQVDPDHQAAVIVDTSCVFFVFTLLTTIARHVDVITGKRPFNPADKLSLAVTVRTMLCRCALNVDA